MSLCNTTYNLQLTTYNLQLQRYTSGSEDDITSWRNAMKLKEHMLLMHVDKLNINLVELLHNMSDDVKATMTAEFMNHVMTGLVDTSIAKLNVAQTKLQLELKQSLHAMSLLKVPDARGLEVTDDFKVPAFDAKSEQELSKACGQLKSVSDSMKEL